jgi:flagellar hook-basal body complex protein FliE
MSNTIDTNAVLLQLRAMAENAGIPSSESTRPVDKVAFSEVLQSSLQSVNERSEVARVMSESFEAGDPDVELADVMIAMQKARISFEAMTQVRNKMVSAYQEIMNMPL